MGDIVTDDINNDIVIDGTGSATINSELDAIEQSLKQRLKSFAGDYFLNLREGIPYFQQILRKNPDPVIVDSAFKRVIINTKGVTKLTSFSLDLASNRELTVSFKVETEEGEINFSEVLP
jgi:hypothetical protein